MGKSQTRKKPELNTSWFIFLFDSIVVLLSGIVGLLSAKGMDANTTFVKIASPIFYSFITLFLTSEVADVITTGTQSSVVFNIITDKAEEVGDAIVQILHRGGTIIHAEGIYTNSTRKNPGLRREEKAIRPAQTNHKRRRSQRVHLYQ